MPFSNPFQKKSSPNDKKGKKFGGIKNIAYFAVGVGADGKERLR